MCQKESYLWRPLHESDLALTRQGLKIGPLGLSCGLWHQSIESCGLWVGASLAAQFGGIRKPWGLCYIPQAIPEQFLSVPEQTASCHLGPTSAFVFGWVVRVKWHPDFPEEHCIITKWSMLFTVSSLSHCLGTLLVTYVLSQGAQSCWCGPYSGVTLPQEAVLGRQQGFGTCQMASTWTAGPKVS